MTSVRNVIGSVPAAGGGVILLHVWRPIEPSSLASLGGRPIQVFPDRAAERVSIGQMVLLRADAKEAASAGLARLNPEIAALRALPSFEFIPAVVDPETETLYLGEAVPSSTDDDGLRKAIYDLSAVVFEQRPAWKRSLGAAAVAALKKRWFRTVFIDGFANGRTLRAGMLLAVAWRLAWWLRRNVSEKRVGLVLPMGLGGAIANLACVLANKVPVNLNFTAGRALNENALQRGEIATVLSAEAMKGKAKDFPWPERTFDLKEILSKFPKWQILLCWVIATLLPATWLRLLIGVSAKGEDRESTLLFTSGSSGEPKGVVLTHRNLLGNIAQVEALLGDASLRSMLACLPIFHSFGCTVTLWWPILGGPTAVTYVSPMETGKLVELIEKHQIALFLTTATFLRGFLRKAEPRQLRSLRMVITGAEKLPIDLATEFESRFQVAVCAGFGMTEASPVVSANLVDLNFLPGTEEYERHRRAGSVGRLLPGMSIRIREPETGADLALSRTGMIWLRGVNLFPGYLHDPQRTDAVLRDGWYCTGDLGRVDEDGFIFIEGRLSRFSKMAGEMVPHGTIEERLVEAFPELGEEFTPVVMGMDDPGKGEILILISSHAMDMQEVRKRLAERGLPNLWIPKLLKQVPEIPRLATGKIDYGRCRKIL